jgi:hypothetical protein
VTVRKNAKFLTPAERESLVRAFVMMKADIVNPAAPPPDRYSVLLEGTYYPGETRVEHGHGATATHGAGKGGEHFVRLLSTSVGLSVKARAARKATGPARRRR